jgi:catechol 2,3-dioxygenase-like lactoylglutathione lyase family enzyme
MAVKRIVPNIAAGDVAGARAFYGDFLGLELAMDMGWILTFTAGATMTPQLSVMTEGGSGTLVPDISIEVDDVDAMHRKAVAMGLKIEYGPADEPWGVRRFYVRDPFGRLVNILMH